MKKVGVALGGGAAHGLAHIGVLQVLKEYDVPIHCVSGSSAGAVIGGLYCAGLDLYELANLGRTLDLNSLLDLSFGTKGFVKGNKAEEMVDVLCNGKKIEECDILFSAVTCDIISGKSVILNKGKISKACHASFAMPGIFEPVEVEGMQLIDGGTMIRVPINEVKKMGAEFVIGVDVGYQGDGHKKAESILEIMLDAFEMSDWQNAERMKNSCNCLISPLLKNIPMHTLDKAQETIEAGRKATLEIIDSIKKDI